MATVTRRYRINAVNLEDLKLRTDLTLSVPDQKFRFFVDITFDNSVAEDNAIDAAMERYGGTYDNTTVAMGPTPFLGLQSPDGAIWELIVDNAGALTTAKRT
jgi:hypothetical protein